MMANFFRAARVAAVLMGLALFASPVSAQLGVAADQALAVTAEPTTPAASAAPAPLDLATLVAGFVPDQQPEQTSDCLARAVYFEARGEPLQGQLAVADVVLNRAASGVYPADVCRVITQRAQFSFVRNGILPQPNVASASWRTALAIAHIARANLARVVAPEVMWYHASYVAPIWTRFHAAVARIGGHIFYS